MTKTSQVFEAIEKECQKIFTPDLGGEWPIRLIIWKEKIVGFHYEASGIVIKFRPSEAVVCKDEDE